MIAFPVQQEVKMFCLGLNRSNVALPQILDLKDHELGVAELYIPASVIQQATKLKIYISNDYGSHFDMQELVQMPVGAFDTHILQSIMGSLDEYLDSQMGENGRLTIKTRSPNIRVKLPRSLTKILGLPVSIIDSTGLEGSDNISFDPLFEHLHVACNLVPRYQFNSSYMPCVYSGSPRKTISAPLFLPCIAAQFAVVQLSFFNMFGEHLNIPDDMFSILLKFQRSRP